MPTLVPVEYDPFAAAPAPQSEGTPLRITVGGSGSGPKFVPVDHDPFAEAPKSPEDQRKEQGAVGTIDAIVRGAADAATFGFSDEIAAGLGALTGIGGTFGDYSGNLARERGLDKADEGVNPVARIGGQLAGGIGGGVGLARNGVTLMRSGMTLPQAVLRGAGEGALYGAAYGAGNADGDLGDRADGAMSGAIGGAAIGGAVPIVARGIGAVTSRAVTPLPVSPERQAMIATLEKEGVPLTAGQRSGSTPLKYAESVFGDATLAGGKAQSAMQKQAEAFTNAAMRRAGASGRATPENMSAAYEKLGERFSFLSARNTLKVDQQMADDIGATLRDYDVILKTEQRQIVGKLVDDLITRIEKNKGTLPGATYQKTRSRWSKLAQNARQNDPDFAEAMRGLRDALDNAMMRSIAPEDAAAWRQAREQYGAWKDLSRAAGGAGANAAEGLISPQALRGAVASGKNKEAYVRGEGAFADLARAGNAIMTPLPNSGTGQRNMMTGQFAGGGTSLALGDPLTAAIVTLGPSVFGRALWSGPIQKYLSNQAITPTARAAIESRIRAALQGAAQSQSPRLSPSR